jgi:hypothetical protein
MSKTNLDALLERVETRLCEWRNCFAGHDLPYDLSDMQKLCEIVRLQAEALRVTRRTLILGHGEKIYREDFDCVEQALDRAEKIAGGNELPQPSFEADDDDDT